ncbi:SMC-Scp complex subunit ScpB [Luminiphilus sp.]|nr:SMC-Scp complex subunit ScpB [Luminiphilus sp.]MDA7840364.1 SMC-Scp complex subunit ScpB [Luminiphilus sp.]
MAETGLVQILEGALMVAGEALSIQRLSQLFDEFDRPANTDLREALDEVGRRCEGRGYELVQVATGYRFQVRQNLSTWVGRLWQERPPRYSRALLETLSLIAYRQPITRGEIEEIRGVAVSTNIIKTLQERDWVRIVGHRDVPGRPAMYATTRQFLDYFNLKSLEELPPLAEIKDLENLSGDLPLEILGAEIAEPETEANAPAIDAETADEMPAGNTSEEPSSEGEHSEAQVAEKRALDQDIAGDTGWDAEDATEGAPELAAPKEQSPTEQVSDEIHAEGELSHEQSPAPAK